RRAGGAGPAGRGLPHPALEDPRPDAPRLALGEPRHVGALGEQLVALDLGPNRRQVQGVQLVLVVDSNRALRVSDLDVLEAPGASAGEELAAAISAAGGIAGALR